MLRCAAVREAMKVRKWGLCPWSVLFDPFPVVVGAAEPETPGIALAVEALIIAPGC